MGHVPKRSGRRRPSIVAATLAALVGVIVSVPPQGAAHADVPAETPAAAPQVPRRTQEQSQAEAVRFRKKFGLAHDDAVIAAARANPHPESYPRYGVALTPAEFAAQAQRDTWAEADGPLHELLAKHKDQFSGVWIDQTRDGAFVVMALPSASPVTKAAVLAAAPAGAPVRFADAAFSGVALDSAYALLSRLHLDATGPTPTPTNPIVELQAKHRVAMETLSADAMGNRVIVGLRGLDKSRRAAVEADWDQYAAVGGLPPRSMVLLAMSGGSRDEESRYASPVTMKAGLELRVTRETASFRCTSNVSASGGVVLTAGHCFNPDERVLHARHEVARGLAYDGYFHGSRADVEALRLHVPRMASRHMFAAMECNFWDTCQRIDRATSVHSGVYSQQERVCMGGAATYWISCGEVIFTNHQQPSTARGPVTFIDQVVADYASQGGDSGGAVGLDGVVHGIHKGRTELDPAACVGCVQPAGTGQTGGSTVELAVFSRMTNALTAMQRSMVTGRTWIGVTSAYAGGKCADVQNNLTANGTPIWSWPCDGGAAQQWSIEPHGPMTPEPNVWWSIKRFSPSSKCMDIDINVSNGARVQEWDCNASSQQTFRFDKYGYDWSSNPSDPSTFRILSMRTDSCVDLDLGLGGTQSGAKIQQWTCLGATQRNQYWRSF